MYYQHHPRRRYANKSHTNDSKRDQKFREDQIAQRNRHQEEVARHVRKERQKKQDALEARRQRYEKMKKLEDDAAVRLEIEGMNRACRDADHLVLDIHATIMRIDYSGAAAQDGG